MHPLSVSPATLPAWHATLLMLPALAAAGAAALSRPGLSPGSAWRLAAWASVAGIVCAVLSLAAALAGSRGTAYGVHAGAAGSVMLLLVAFVAWVIVRYSRPYLAGERHERRYVRWLMATVAAVLVVATTNDVLVLALAWSATSLALHRLLTFFGERPAAVTAAHKKFIVSRAAELCLLAAIMLLYQAYGTLDIAAIQGHAAAEPQTPLAAQGAALLIAFAAILKCAQLPFHGWLIQVMEAPTPVSALLHAGVVNLGGFVLIRFATLLAHVPAAQVLLLVLGTATAVLAALVMSTRISVKVMLAWSTCAQMGYMLMECGLGAWELALLHLVAHSLYKAHAFLSAGGAVRRSVLAQMAPPVPTAVLGRTLALTLAGACVMLGAGAAWHALLGSWVAANAPTLPATAGIGVVLAFGTLFGLQAALRLQARSTLARRLYPWFYGGLFLDEAFSRWAFSLWRPPAPEAEANPLPSPQARLIEAKPRAASGVPA